MATESVKQNYISVRCFIYQ